MMTDDFNCFGNEFCGHRKSLLYFEDETRPWKLLLVGRKKTEGSSLPVQPQGRFMDPTLTPSRCVTPQESRDEGDSKRKRKIVEENSTKVNWCCILQRGATGAVFPFFRV